jgi:hypothetical protein
MSGDARSPENAHHLRMAGDHMSALAAYIQKLCKSQREKRPCHHVLSTCVQIYRRNPLPMLATRLPAEAMICCNSQQFKDSLAKIVASPSILKNIQTIYLSNIGSVDLFTLYRALSYLRGRVFARVVLDGFINPQLLTLILQDIKIRSLVLQVTEFQLTKMVSLSVEDLHFAEACSSCDSLKVDALNSLWDLRGNSGSCLNCSDELKSLGLCVVGRHEALNAYKCQEAFLRIRTDNPSIWPNFDLNLVRKLFLHLEIPIIEDIKYSFTNLLVCHLGGQISSEQLTKIVGASNPRVLILDTFVGSLDVSVAESINRMTGLAELVIKDCRLSSGFVRALQVDFISTGNWSLIGFVRCPETEELVGVIRDAYPYRVVIETLTDYDRLLRRTWPMLETTKAFY